MNYYVRGNSKSAKEIHAAFEALGLDTNNKTFDDNKKVYWGDVSDNTDNKIGEAEWGGRATEILVQLEELGACHYLDY